jgi:hypothetical protein
MRVLDKREGQLPLSIHTVLYLPSLQPCLQVPARRCCNGDTHCPILTLTPTLSSGACEEVLQWGFDETSLDGQSCVNQWCLIRTGGVPVFPHVHLFMALHHLCFVAFVVVVSRRGRHHCHRGVFWRTVMLHSCGNSCTYPKNVGESARSGLPLSSFVTCVVLHLYHPCRPVIVTFIICVM